MTRSFVRRSLWAGLAVFVLFFWYFNLTGDRLPFGAGPDSAAHYDVTRFIYAHGRLPVWPDDQSEIKLTAYGTTRALRPPLAYIVSAAVARVIPGADQDLPRAFRYGSALLGAATVAVAFWTLHAYVGSAGLALIGALLLGLIPQFAFIASYINDDIGAVFSATLAVMAMVLVRRSGLSMACAALLGFAAGLIVLSKLTAWMLLPFVGLFTLCHWRRWFEDFVKLSLVLVAMFLIGGAWWVLFNMYHYGIGDPVATGLSRHLMDTFGRKVMLDRQGFAADGIGIGQLVFGNHGNFLGESFKSTIGNLDWLRLRVGPLQYGLYLLVLLVAVVGTVWRTVAAGLAPSAQARGGSGADLAFEWLLLGAVAFQFFMYTWANLYNEIQVQGKYMLPATISVLVLFSATVSYWTGTGRRSMERWLWPGVTTLELPLSRLLGALAVVLVVAVHAHALITHVIPFYYPGHQYLNVKHFRQLDLTDPSVIHHSRDVSIEPKNGGWRVVATGSNPAIVMGRPLCDLVTSPTVLIRIRMHSSRDGNAALLLNNGDGYHETRTVRSRVVAGDNAMVFGLGVDRCHRIRFDPFAGRGEVTVTEVAVAPIGIDPYNPPK